MTCEERHEIRLLIVVCDRQLVLAVRTAHGRASPFASTGHLVELPNRRRQYWSFCEG